MNHIKNEETARLADDLLGAALVLELAAQHLKQNAKHLRTTGLVENPDAVAVHRMHKRHDVQMAAEKALKELA